jgi:hypothetical protein
MAKVLHGLKDIHTVITNQRKIGGAVEAQHIRLSSGEEYSHPVFTNIDVSRGQFVSIGFIDEEGNNLLVHVNEIAMIKGLEHKLICQLRNSFAKEMLLEQTLRYLTRLCEINEGFVTRSFRNELTRLVVDVSLQELEKKEIHLPFTFENNVIQMNERKFA